MKLKRASLIVIWAAVVSFVPMVASSQSKDESQNPPPPSAVESEPQSGGQSTPGRRMTPTWEDGLVFESSDGDYRFQVGGLVRFDGRFAPQDPGHVTTDTFLMRTLRARFQGRVARYFTFRFWPDFTGAGGATVADAYIDIDFSDAFHLRVGRDKTPVGFEALLGDANVLFLERGVTSSLGPGRDAGVQAHGDLRGGKVSYAVGLYNGVVDGTSTNANDTDSAKDLAGRVVVHPFDSSAIRPLSRLGLAFGGSTGRQGNAGLPSFRTSVQQVYFSYAAEARADGPRTRLSPQAFYYYKGLGAFWEYARSRQGVSTGAAHADVLTTAWQLDGSFILTGETAGERVHPNRAFDPKAHTWGAVQMTARYGSLTFDPAVFALGLADGKSSRQAKTETIGAIWFMTTNVKTLFNVERSVFDGNPNGSRYAEHAILVRLQLNY